MNLPTSVADAVKGERLVQKRLGRSGDQVYAVGKGCFLKISANLPALRREKEMALWLQGRLPAPQVIAYEEQGELGYLVTTRVKGKPACYPQYLKDPEALCSILAEAVALLKKVDPAGCPYSAEGEGEAFVHGDCCLPNVMVFRGKVSGFVDLGQSGKGDPWQDYAWLLWSLAYNLGTQAYNELMMEKLGIVFDAEKYSRYVE